MGENYEGETARGAEKGRERYDLRESCEGT